MKKLPILMLVGFVAFCFLFAPKIFSDEYDDLSKQIQDLNRALELSKAATAPHERELKSMQDQIKNIKNKVGSIEEDIAIKKGNIDKGYENLTEQKKIFDHTVVNHYITSYYDNLLSSIISVASAEELIQNLAYKKAQADQNKVIITNIALSITDLETKKNNLENEQKRLTVIKTDLDNKSAELDKLVSGARTYQSTLSSQIAALSARQQEILGQRLAGLNIPRSAGTGAPACIDDRDKDPGFSPRLAFFTYGVPNRTGLNQYGAWGRAKAGQNEEQILQAYYSNFELKKDYDTGITIQVEGYGGYNIEDYVRRIYEMPESWTDNNLAALKAQVIAARSYALAYTNNGQNSICTTQQCQVFKSDPKGGAWNEAVEATKGWVMVSEGKPMKAWYSSTHGGYVFPTSELPGWSSTSWTKKAIDTTTGSAGSFGDLHSNAYDRESPWFYCDWGSRTQYNKTAWLKPDEVADIVNIILLARADSSTREKLYQTDKPHPYGGEVWSQDKVKSELRSRSITPYNSVSDVSVNADFGNGRTTSVNVSGDAGSQSFDGSEFKDWFNLRAPANIQIVGPLYNIEKK